MGALIRSVATSFLRAIRFVLAVLRTIFGQVRWSPPPWIESAWRATSRGAVRVSSRLAAARRRNPKRFWISTASIAVLTVGGALGVHWYRNRPEPRYVELNGTWPQATELTPDAKFNPLRLSFSASAARLGAVGKPVSARITIDPSLDGVWKWETDSELTFTPSHDWEIGRNYTITLSRQLFPPQVLLRNYTYRFRSPAFEGRITAAQFYEDPTDPKNKRVVATIAFTHPIDKADFEKRIAFRLRVEPVKSFDSRATRAFGFNIGYDQTGAIAYVHSDPLAIPDKDAEMQISIGPDVHSSRGGPGTAEALIETVQIPGIARYFRIQGVTAQAVATERDEMERVATLSSSVLLKQSDLARSISVVMLPKDRPAVGDQPLMENFAWSDPAEVVPQAMALATPVAIQWLPSEREFNPEQSFKFTADRGRYILVTVRSGLVGFGGYKLSKDYARVIAVPNFPNLLKIGSAGSVLSLSGEKKISIVSRGVDAMQIEVSRLLPGSVSHLVSQTQGSFSRPDFRNPQFGYDDVSQVFTVVRPLPFDAAAAVQYSVFDFGPLLSSGALPRGLFFVQISAWDPIRKQLVPGGPSDNRLILLSDLGMLVKDSIDDTHDVFVQSIRTGQPLAGIEVEVLGKNGLPVVSNKTDANSHVAFPSLKDFAREKTPTVYIVENGGDFSFLPYDRSDRQLDLSRFDTGGLYTVEAEESLRAYLFSDRGIYRPGDQIHIGLLIKRADWKAIPAGLPLELAVNDPRGYEIRRSMIKFGPEGFAEYTTATQEDSPTGAYQFSLYIVRDKQPKALLGSTSVRVEDFQPDRMTIKATLSAPSSLGWISPAGLTGQVLLRNLFGTAAAGRRIKGSLKLAPSGVPSTSIPTFGSSTSTRRPRVTMKTSARS